MKTLLIVVGVILLLSGLVFMGQGSRFFPYPAESFMIGASQWVYYGGGMALVGLVLLIERPALMKLRSAGESAGIQKRLLLRG